MLVACLCDSEEQYYLSCNELLLACELNQTDVMVFGTRAEHADYLGSVTGFRNEIPMLVSLHVGEAGARVRSHFQRMVMMSHAMQVQRGISEEDQS